MTTDARQGAPTIERPTTPGPVPPRGPSFPPPPNGRRDEEYHPRVALPPPPARPGRIQRYAVAALTFGAALPLAWWLQTRLGHGSFAALSAAVVVAAWYGGIGPGLAVSAASVVAVSLIFIDPAGLTGVERVLDLIPLGVLAAVSILVSASAESMRRARREASDRAVELAETNRLLREERAAAELARGHLERLFDVTAALSSAVTPAAVAEVVVERGMHSLGASAGSIATVDEARGTLDLIGARGYPADAVARFARVGIDADFPLADAVRERAPVVLSTAAERDARYPALSELRRRNGGGAMAAVPLFAGETIIGALGFNFPESRPVDAADRQFLFTLAQQCAHALERARLYEAERASRAEAERANRAKGEFLAMMSHELRTPLNAIAGYTELLELGVRGPVTGEQREDLSRIRRSQRHLLGIINDILNFAKIEAGQVHYQIEPVEVDEVLAGLAPLVEPQLAARSLAYELRPAGAGVAALADCDKLQQVLLNLLSNAVKFTPPGGGIVVEAEGDRAHVRIRVRDTGIGIPAARQASIFEPFVQLDASLHGAREGTGLGLAISRDLARAMGGDLGVESAPGEGSTFTCTLRRAAT